MKPLLPRVNAKIAQMRIATAIEHLEEATRYIPVGEERAHPYPETRYITAQLRHTLRDLEATWLVQPEDS